MGGFKEYGQYDAMGLADLVKKGDVTASELCEEAIERIEQVNPKLNAVVTPMYDAGRSAAARLLPDGPFAGVPFVLKDLLAAFAGVPMTRPGPCATVPPPWTPPMARIRALPM
jgi:amidase